MGFLFLTLMKGEHSNQSTEVWSAVTSDRSKRDMLLAAVNGMWIHPDANEERQSHEFARGLVKKLVGAASGLEDARNNAIHALHNKDLLAEFRWCRDYAYSYRPPDPRHACAAIVVRAGH
jgi:hypothetical protein